MSNFESEIQQACLESFNDSMKKYEQADENEIEFSKKYRREINRINREVIGGKKAIYPEADNAFQRWRSSIIRIIK